MAYQEDMRAVTITSKIIPACHIRRRSRKALILLTANAEGWYIQRRCAPYLKYMLTWVSPECVRQEYIRGCLSCDSIRSLDNGKLSIRSSNVYVFNIFCLASVKETSNPQNLSCKLRWDYLPEQYSNIFYHDSTSLHVDKRKDVLFAITKISFSIFCENMWKDVSHFAIRFFLFEKGKHFKCSLDFRRRH